MNQRLMAGCLVLVLAGASTVLAQSLKPAGSPNANADGRTHVFDENADRILKAVNPADPESAERLRNLLRKWDQSYSSNGIHAPKPGAKSADPGLLEKRDVLEKEAKEAAASGDAAKAEKANSDLAHVVALINGVPPEQEVTRQAIDAKLKAAAGEFLPPEELNKLEAVIDQVWADAGGGGRGRNAPERSPIALKKIVDRLQDLTQDQRERIDQAFRAHQQSSRSAPAKENPAATKSRDVKLYDDVFAILTDGQKERVERDLRGRDAAGDKAAEGTDKPGDAGGKPAAAQSEKTPKESAEAAKGSESKGAEPKK